MQFYQVVRVDPGNSRVIARLTNQVPLLLEKQVGEGRVLVFTSTFDKIANDFPLHASFVPFVEETARYLGGQQEQSTNVAVDSYIELRSAKEHGAAVEVIDPDGKHPLSLKEATTAQSFQVTREGFYEIHRANGRAGIRRRPRRPAGIGPDADPARKLWNCGAIPAEASRPSGPGDTSDNTATAVEPVALRFAIGLNNSHNRISDRQPILIGGEGGSVNERPRSTQRVPATPGEPPSAARLF